MQTTATASIAQQTLFFFHNTRKLLPTEHAAFHLKKKNWT
jgi:hypothetical protein